MPAEYLDHKSEPKPPQNYKVQNQSDFFCFTPLEGESGSAVCWLEYKQTRLVY